MAPMAQRFVGPPPPQEEDEPFVRLPQSVARQHNRINDVNDAIVSRNVGLNDLCAIHGDAVTALGD